MQIFYEEEPADPEFTPHEKIKNEGCWTMTSKKYTAEGSKRFYVCRYGAFACPVRAYVLDSPMDGQKLFRSTEGHDLSTHKEKTGLPQVYQEKIEEVYLAGANRPRDIMRKLDEESKKHISKNSLVNVLKKLRLKYEGESLVKMFQDADGNYKRKRGRPPIHKKD